MFVQAFKKYWFGFPSTKSHWPTSQPPTQKPKRSFYSSSTSSDRTSISFLIPPFPLYCIPLYCTVLHHHGGSYSNLSLSEHGKHQTTKVSKIAQGTGKSLAQESFLSLRHQRRSSVARSRTQEPSHVITHQLHHHQQPSYQQTRPRNARTAAQGQHEFGDETNGAHGTGT
jgi:hypothetical protein